MRIFPIAALLLLAALLGACTQARPTPNVILVTPSATAVPSPLATPAAPLSPLATPLRSPLATPGAGPGAGPAAAAPTATQLITGGGATITGYLLEGAGSPKPAAGVIVALASIVPDAAGTRALASYDPATAPRTQTDASGHFVFTNVKAQPYALILDRVFESFMLNDPKTAGDMVFTPQPGEVLDLGKLVYDKLPGSQTAP